MTQRSLPQGNEPLLSAEQVHALLGESGVVLLDATMAPPGVASAPDPRTQYRAGHLPGAVFFDIDALSDHTTTLPHMLPEEETFGRSLGALGLQTNDLIVVYEQSGVFSAPRARWMLRTMGAQTVYLLDGGLPAWIAAGYPLERGEVQRPATVFRARREASAVCSVNEVREALGSNVQDPGAKAPFQLADARPAPRFRGEAPEPRPGIASGHMPGAHSVPASSLIRDGRLLPPEAAREVFEAAGLDLGQPIVTTCGSGVTAAILSLQLERLGIPKTRLFDGSWAEYAQQPGARIVTGA